jgi:hypothetical protein
MGAVQLDVIKTSILYIGYCLLTIITIAVCTSVCVHPLQQLCYKAHQVVQQALHSQSEIVCVVTVVMRNRSLMHVQALMELRIQGTQHTSMMYELDCLYLQYQLLSCNNTNACAMSCKP